MDETTTDTSQQATPTPTPTPTPMVEPDTISDTTPATSGTPEPNPIEGVPLDTLNSQDSPPPPAPHEMEPPPPTPDYIGVPYVETTPSVEIETLDNPSPSGAPEAPSVVERAVERLVEREVIKEVPKEVFVEKIVEKIVEVEKVVEKIVEVEKLVEVEKIVEKPVEKIVYRNGEPKACPPPTDEEIEAIKKDFLINLSKQGTTKKHELMIEKLGLIMNLFDTQTSITHKDVMVYLECSGTTATRLLTELRHENKITLHGTSPHTFTYTKP